MNSIPATSPTTPVCSRGERLLALAMLLAVLLVRVVYIYRYRVDSDEPQHLHVAWQWSVGLIGYRDFFDNHTPLFHLLTAPILRWFGERADILDRARLFMVPLYLLALGAVRVLARSLFSARIALWAPIFVGAFPNYLFPTVEFRTDNLWAPLWLAALAILFSGPVSPRRSFAAGLLAGASLAASMKTLLLAGALGAATVPCLLIARRDLPALKPGRLLVHVASGLAGFAIVPGILVAVFASLGALKPMTSCLFEHQILPPGVDVEHRPPRLAALAAVCLVLIFAVLWLMRRWGSGPRTLRRGMLFLHAGFVLATLELAWPVLTRQNYLPVYPLAMLFLSAAIISATEELTRRIEHPWPGPILATLVASMLAWATIARPIDVDLTLASDHFIQDALRLTEPGEFIMSYKGEPVYRRRPYYYVLEPFTRARLEHGLLPDDIARRLVETRTLVAMTLTRKLPPHATEFLEANYLPVGPLRVAGMPLPPPDAAGNIRFQIKLPAAYTLLANDEPAGPAEMDGQAFSPRTMLEPGEHVLRFAERGHRLALLWTRAVERGFRPKPEGYQPERIGSEF